ncbi:hypothetical protein AB0L40_05560 [Patulibacter sp. NPDC049589]|uniref:hypothetical protein n=1 Tax=Patulibacter sp. NPDC049589 TaxID=3154731 RepID=UPI0034470F96
MSRLPDLERALHAAARRLDDEPDATPARSRWRRTRLPLLVSVGTLAVAGGAIAATGALSTGDPVPPDPQARPAGWSGPDPGSERVIGSVSAKDPDGGPDWGIRIYSPRRPRGIVCTGIGRVQDDTIGVVGRDGVFHDDGRFHPLPPEASQSGTCGGTGGGHLYQGGDGPSVPASGYTGRPGSSIGGCKEFVKDPMRTQSKWTRRRLRNVPVCDPAGQRIVKWGFAGPDARKVTYVTGGTKHVQEVSSDDDGAYIFVLRPKDAGRGPRTLTITRKDGSLCDPATMSCIPTVGPTGSDG